MRAYLCKLGFLCRTVGKNINIDIHSNLGGAGDQYFHAIWELFCSCSPEARHGLPSSAESLRSKVSALGHNPTIGV
jgi:hypothetical protein